MKAVPKELVGKYLRACEGVSGSGTAMESSWEMSRYFNSPRPLRLIGARVLMTGGDYP